MTAIESNHSDDLVPESFKESVQLRGVAVDLCRPRVLLEVFPYVRSRVEFLAVFLCPLFCHRNMDSNDASVPC